VWFHSHICSHITAVDIHVNPVKPLKSRDEAILQKNCFTTRKTRKGEESEMYFGLARRRSFEKSFQNVS
jgi:hypothetical protein